MDGLLELPLRPEEGESLGSPTSADDDSYFANSANLSSGYRPDEEISEDDQALIFSESLGSASPLSRIPSNVSESVYSDLDTITSRPPPLISYSGEREAADPAGTSRRSSVILGSRIARNRRIIDYNNFQGSGLTKKIYKMCNSN